METHEILTVHAGIGNEKRPVQPHKVETQVSYNRWCVLDTEWAGKEDRTSRRKISST